MRVVCDNCGASYKIPDSKLTKEVNKATCRKCGHAIFIRRAGEEEPRTVASQPAQQNEERTLITSAADLERTVRARAGSSFDEVDQRPTTVSLDGGHGEATVPRDFAPAPAAATPPPVAPPPPAPPPAAAARTLAPPPPPAPARSPAIAPSPLISPAAAAPKAAEPAAAAPAAAPHSPKADLSMALVALFATVLGVLVLAVAAVLGNGMVAGLGVFLALLGILIVAFIVITGRMGQKPANLIVSFAGSFLLASFGGAATTGALYLLQPDPTVAEVTPPVTPPIAPPVTPPVTPPVAVTPPVDPVTPPTDPAAPPTDPAATLAATTTPVTTTPATTTPATTPATTTPATTTPATTTPPPTTSKTTASTTPAATTTTKTPVSSTSTTKSSTPTKTTTTTTTKTEEPKARITPSTTSSTSSSTSTKTTTKTTEPASTSSSSSSSASKSSGVSAVVVDTMIKSNKAVKSCFINQRAETGELPKGVKVKMSIQSSGKVSSASIPSGDWQGTPFDSCLSGAVKSIQFPPFEGDAVTLTYPFAI